MLFLFCKEELRRVHLVAFAFALIICFQNVFPLWVLFVLFVCWINGPNVLKTIGRSDAINPIKLGSNCLMHPLAIEYGQLSQILGTISKRWLKLLKMFGKILRILRNSNVKCSKQIQVDFRIYNIKALDSCFYFIFLNENKRKEKKSPSFSTYIKSKIKRMIMSASKKPILMSLLSIFLSLSIRITIREDAVLTCIIQ